MTQLLQQTIDAAWENRAQISPAQAPADVREAVRHVLAELDAGRLRVATREGVGQWTVHQCARDANPVLVSESADPTAWKTSDLHGCGHECT